eukprot:1896776-Prymnesium_polylepis.1
MYEPEGGGRAQRWKGTVSKGLYGSNPSLDTFEITFSNKQVMQGDDAMPKAELVDALCGDSTELLEKNERWQLRNELTEYRFVAFSHFMLDLHSQLAILSKGNQAKSLIISDLSRNVNNNAKALSKLLSSAGEEEATLNAIMGKSDGSDA